MTNKKMKKIPLLPGGKHCLLLQNKTYVHAHLHAQYWSNYNILFTLIGGVEHQTPVMKYMYMTFDRLSVTWKSLQDLLVLCGF